MRAIKKIGCLFLGLAAFFTLNANAQTQNVAVSCNWVQTGSQSGPYTAIITFQCQESNGNVAATRSLTYSAPNWAVTYCTISLASGVFNSGSCQSTNLYRQVIPPTSTCTTPGVRIQGGCVNSYDSSMLTNPIFLSRCGSGCALEYRTVGWTSACPNSGNGRSPEYGIYCK